MEKHLFNSVVWIKSVLNVCVFTCVGYPVDVCIYVCVCVCVCGRGGAHGCFLWANGKSGVRGQCLGVGEQEVTVGMR